MSDAPVQRPNILFLFSDTGGGHRSAAEAVIEALQLEYGDRLSTTMVDIFKDAAPPPLDRMPDLYPYMVKVPQVWETGYKLSNGQHRASLISETPYPYVRRGLRRVIRRCQSDVIVSLHPLANAPFLRALGVNHPPFITIVTDLATTHALWYHPGVDLCLVPTEEARRRAIKNNIDPDRVQVVGLPVADRFCQPTGDRAALRRQLGWPADLPVAILVGGGEGMGPLEKTALAIAEARLPLSLAIITGRNRKLKASLQSRDWPMPTFIYGFVREMPDFMNAADILLTKAGPGTITEALNAGLPMILYSRLPGQEDGNVVFVVAEGAGVWAPKPREIVSVLQGWLANPEKLLRVAENCRRVAHPQASRQIAHILAGWAGLTP
jgi:1,2-diacylglycerol 3-beta-galactosyltransferase